MDAFRKIVAGVLLATALGAALQASVQIGSAASACAGGTAGGECSIPMTRLGVGELHGRFIDEATEAVAYEFDARLVDVPAPCQGCIQGEVQGTLDDGSGGPPELVVAGEYAGTLFGGIGQIHLRVFRTSGGPAVGTFDAAFEDPPGDEDHPGRFTGEWRICP